MLTLEELKQRICERVDEITFLEIFNLSTEELVEMFHDKIEEKYEELLKEYDDE